MTNTLITHCSPVRIKYTILIPQLTTQFVAEVPQVLALRSMRTKIMKDSSKYLHDYYMDYVYPSPTHYMFVICTLELLSLILFSVRVVSLSVRQGDQASPRVGLDARSSKSPPSCHVRILGSFPWVCLELLNAAGLTYICGQHKHVTLSANSSQVP